MKMCQCASYMQWLTWDIYLNMHHLCECGLRSTYLTGSLESKLDVYCNWSSLIDRLMKNNFKNSSSLRASINGLKLEISLLAASSSLNVIKNRQIISRNWWFLSVNLKVAWYVGENKNILWLFSRNFLKDIFYLELPGNVSK